MFMNSARIIARRGLVQAPVGARRMGTMNPDLAKKTATSMGVALALGLVGGVMWKVYANSTSNKISKWYEKYDASSPNE
jgi:hypothetical protein